VPMHCHGLGRKHLRLRHGDGSFCTERKLCHHLVLSVAPIGQHSVAIRSTTDWDGV
jgi:hypothetical protein